MARRTRLIGSGAPASGGAPIGGTIANTQVAFGNGTVIAGDAGFTYNSTTDTASFNGSANSLNLAGSATTLPVTLTATGTDTNVGFQITPKGGGSTSSFSTGGSPDPLAAGFMVNSTITTQGTGYGYYGDLNANTAFLTTINPAANDADYNIYTASLIAAQSASANNKNISEIHGASTIAKHHGSGTAGFVSGSVYYGEAFGPVSALWGTYGYSSQSASTADSAGGSYAGVNVGGNATVTELISGAFNRYVNTGCAVTRSYGLYVYVPGGIGAATNYGLWMADQTVTGGTSDYGIWYDSPGVWRLKSDGVVAYYNPAFTKYTPDAANLERIVTQWTSSVAEIGTEATGTGTLRPLKLLGSAIRSGVDVVVQDNTKGFVLKDTAGTPHYWRLSISTLGVITTADLGTTLPG